MRAGARTPADVRAGHERLQSLGVYRIYDDARTVGQFDQVIEASQYLIGVVVVTGSAVDAETVGEQDHALSTGEVAQAAYYKAGRAERAGREAGILEFREAVGHGLLIRLLFGLRGVHLIGAAGVGETRHHIAAERIPDQLLDSGVKNSLVAGELFQHPKA